MTDASKLVKYSAAPKRKPPAAGKGRPKGATNKMTRTIKAAIEEAFGKVGGADYLAKMAVQQPAAFMTLLGKVLPTQLEHSGPGGAPIAASIDVAKLSTDALREIVAARDNAKSA